MKTRIAPLVIVLMFLSALIISDLQLAKGQAAPMDKRVRLSRYGVVLSITGPNGKEVTSFQHEGYAVAYRIKDRKTGKEEDRLAYAFGGQQVSNLEVMKQPGTQVIVRTKDGVLAITSEATWDEKLNELRTWRSVEVTAKTEVVLLAIESHADAERKANDAAQVAAAVQATQAELVPKGIGGHMGKCDCPPCSPGRPCLQMAPDVFLALLYKVKSGGDVSGLIAGGAGMGETTEMSKGNLVNVLSWKRGVNMPSDPITRGKGLTAFSGYMIK